MRGEQIKFEGRRERKNTGSKGARAVEVEGGRVVLAIATGIVKAVVTVMGNGNSCIQTEEGMPWNMRRDRGWVRKYRG